MNGEVCCILGVCCPPGSERQSNALAKEMAQDLSVDVTECTRYARWVLKHFDLAPKGTVTPLIVAAAKLQRDAAV